MIYFLDDGKVIIEFNGETYEFIKNTRLAKLMCEKFIICEDLNYYYDKISYVIDTEYVYYDIKTDNIYIWSNIDTDKNISDNIIWYHWINNDFVLIKGEQYDNINNEYINNKLVLLKDVLVEYNDLDDNDLDDNDIKREETSSDDLSETSSDDLSETSSDDTTSDSDFIVDTSSEELSQSSDINESSVSIVDNINNMNNIDYMSEDNIKYRKEYVSNLINIVNSTQNIDNERLSIMLNYYNHYYST
tara:strand:+ start:174 stop:911 length:738 start_codon:yes stop_codon:yes gene_type:complete